jgi:sodium transport system permease protein
LTGNPLKTLLLDRAPNLAACGAAVLLAAALHPVSQLLTTWIVELYPVQKETLAEIQKLFNSTPNFWSALVLIAVLPAVCEELAFRGFILSGFRHLGHKWWAIGLTALFFGFTHSLIQQSLAATVVGLVIGYVAVQSGSLVPCILFHFTHNGIALAVARLQELAEGWPGLQERLPFLRQLAHRSETGQFAYPWYVVAACGVVAALLLYWFHRLPVQATKEEQLSDARARQSEHPLAGGAPSGVE